jgi:hypothetical protein
MAAGRWSPEPSGGGGSALTSPTAGHPKAVGVLSDPSPGTPTATNRQGYVVASTLVWVVGLHATVATLIVSALAAIIRRLFGPLYRWLASGGNDDR